MAPKIENASVSFSSTLGHPVCTGCMACLEAKVPSEHFRKTHKMTSEKAAKLGAEYENLKPKELTAQTNRYFNQPHAESGEEPLPYVPELKLFIGVKCPFCSLPFLRSVIRKHIQAKHKETLEDDSLVSSIDTLPSIYMQTMYKNNSTNYFIVKHPESSKRGSDTKLAAFLKNLEHYDGDERDSGAHEDKTKNAFLGELHGFNFLEELGVTLETAYPYTIAKNQEDEDGVTKAILKYFNFFCCKRPPVPICVRERAPLKGSRWNMNIEEKSRKRYSKEASRLVFCASGIRRIELKAGVSYCTDEVSKLANDVIFSAKSSNSSSSTLQCVHKFFKSVLLAEAKCYANERILFEDLFLFIAACFKRYNTNRIQGINADAATHFLAAIKYTLQITAIGEFFEHPHGFGPPRHCKLDSKADAEIQRLINTDGSTTASFVCHLLAVAWRIKKAEEPPSKFNPFPRTEEPGGTIGNLVVLMNSTTEGSLGFGYRNLRTKAKQFILSKLLLGFKVPNDFWDRVSRFQDNTLTMEPGWFFGSHSVNKEYLRRIQQDFLEHVLNEHNPILGWTRATSSSDLSQLQYTQFTNEWLNACVEFKKPLFVLLVIGGGTPPRGTEYSRLRMRNSATGRRNVFIGDHRVYLLTTYNKTQSLGEPTPKLITRFYDNDVMKLLVLFICFISVVEAIAVKSLFHSSGTTLEYIFSEKGKLTAEYDLNKSFWCLTTEMKLPLNITTYRHYYTGIVDFFFGNSSNPFALLDAAHQQAGHSSKTANMVYAISEKGHRGVLGSQVESFKWTSETWSEMLGSFLGVLRYSDAHMSSLKGRRRIKGYAKSVNTEFDIILKELQGVKKSVAIMQSKLNQTKEEGPLRNKSKSPSSTNSTSDDNSSDFT